MDEQSVEIPQTLRFESPSKNLGVTAPSSLHSATVDDWRVFETFKQSAHAELRDKKIGAYSIAVEREVSSQDEAWSGLHKASQLADEIDVAWCYAWGKPYIARRLQLQAIEAPRKWTGNFRGVEGEIAKQRKSLYFAAVQVVSLDWDWLPQFPLARVLEARKYTVQASPVIRELMELHTRSHKELDDGNLFLLAKSLEIVGAFFRGSRTDRNSGIELEMTAHGLKAHLTRSVEWLFDIMNERFDVRHAWDRDSPGVVLHPRMTPEEKTAFEANADLVVRGFICARLGMDEIPVFGSGAKPTQGYWPEVNADNS